MLSRPRFFSSSEGLIFAGTDVIGDRPGEIKLNSLTGTQGTDRFAGMNIDAAIWASIEAKARYPAPAITGHVPVTQDERLRTAQTSHHTVVLSHDL